MEKNTNNSADKPSEENKVQNEEHKQQTQLFCMLSKKQPTLNQADIIQQTQSEKQDQSLSRGESPQKDLPNLKEEEEKQLMTPQKKNSRQNSIAENTIIDQPVPIRQEPRRTEEMKTQEADRQP